MITKTSREIITEALILANADNSDFTNFFLNTTLLNNAYREIYDIITNNTLAYIATCTTTTDMVLPEDCWSIISVTDSAGTPVPQSSLVGHNDGGYWVENNTFKVPIGRTTTYTIMYSTIPDTLTAPGLIHPITLTEDIDPTIFNSCTYTDGECTITPIGTTTTFQDGTLTWEQGVLTYNGTDVTDQFHARDAYSIQVHDPYVVVTDNTHKIWIYTGFSTGQLWNYNCIYGHTTTGTVTALCTDDTTGYGMVLTMDGQTYYAPFVPDTVLSYPNNTLFTLLEYKIAYMYANLLGMHTVDFLASLVQDATDKFYNQLGPTSNVHRYNNYRANRRRIW